MAALPAGPLAAEGPIPTPASIPHHQRLTSILLLQKALVETRPSPRTVFKSFSRVSVNGALLHVARVLFASTPRLSLLESVNSLRLGGAVEGLAGRRGGLVKFDEAGGGRGVRGEVGPRAGQAGGALQSVGDIGH